MSERHSEQRLLTEREAALYISMSHAYLRQERLQGRGPTHLRLGRVVRYRVSDLDAWLSSRTVKGSE